MTITHWETEVARPTVTALPSRLLDVATVVDRPHLQIGATNAMFSSLRCVTPYGVQWICDVETPDDKTFDDTPGWQSGAPFIGALGTMCKAIGYDFSEQESLASEAFDESESKFIEASFAAARFHAETDLWAAPTDVTPTPGTAVTPEVGLALLEGHAALNYAGVPTIHTSRTIVSLLAQDGGVDLNGSVITSELGSKFASGGGYEALTGPDEVAPDAGEYWMYATGEVVILRGEKFVRQEMDRSTNEVFILVERPYIGVVDCYAAAVLVKVE